MRFEDGFAGCRVWTLVTLKHDSAVSGSKHRFIVAFILKIERWHNVNKSEN